MSLELQPTTSPLPPLRGRPGICQGIYGECGNLELFAPDAEDGFWVFWFNSATHDVGEQGALPGEWSGGLHVRTGERTDAVTVAQVPWGPNNLEVVTMANGRARRWIWTATDGFLRGEDLGLASDIGTVQGSGHGSGVELRLTRPNGATVLLTSPTDAYPHLRWSEAPDAGTPSDPTICASDMCGVRRAESVTTVDGILRHRRRQDDGETQEREVVSRVLWPQGRPVHRSAPDTPDLEARYPRT